MSLRSLSIGGATYDLFLSMNPEIEKSISDHKKIIFDLGKKVPIEKIVESCGGGASNTSVGLSRLGMQAAFCGIIGADQWGEKLLKNMQDEGVNTKPATIIENETSSFSMILLLSSGERTILYNSGVNEHLQDATFDSDFVSDTDLVYLNHLCERSCMIEDDLIAALKKKKQIFLAWNPGGSKLDNGIESEHTKELLAHTSFFVVNKEEALRFTGGSDIQGAMAKLRTTGAVNICITDGPNGSFASNADGCWFCPPLAGVRVLDATGAGDAFGTAAAWALVTGQTLPNALIAGTLNASSVVETMGAQKGLLSYTEIQLQLRTKPLVTTPLDW